MKQGENHVRKKNQPLSPMWYTKPLKKYLHSLSVNILCLKFPQGMKFLSYFCRYL